MRRLLPILLLAIVPASAELVRLEVSERSDVLGGKAFGTAGAYERVKGRAYFAVDPRAPQNQIVCDLGLAPDNAAGKVEFSADFYILRPREPERGNGTLLFEVSNRGGKAMLGMFDLAKSSRDPRSVGDFGDGMLLEAGFTLAWVGWQFDVPEGADALSLRAPAIKGLTGLVRSEYTAAGGETGFSLADRTLRVAYPAASADDPADTLTVRDRTESPRRTIPRASWKFSEDRTQVRVTGGLKGGKLYDVVYKAQDPAVVGLGPAAVRDFVSYLRYGGGLKRAIGFGISQSGRFLRSFLYYGFNQDERGRKVFDGLMPHVAGASRGSFNHRFAQPSRDAHAHQNTLYPTVLFPFTDLDETDPLTGRTDGLLRRARAARVVPRIFYTNGSYEYYGRACALIHTALDGKTDAALPPEVRIYLFAGAQHGPAAFPPRRDGSQNLPNPNDFRFSMRALLMSMHRWLADGVEPPASNYPSVARGQLAPMSEVRFPKLPSRAFVPYRLDFGPEFSSRGIVAFEPPKVGPPYPLLLPQVDEDGNEASGIRLPDIAVPLGVYTGWNLRDASIGAPDELYSMVGSFIPFPRAEVAKRYATREVYLEKVDAEVRALIRKGYLLERDRPRLLDRAATQFDWVRRADRL